MKLFIIISFFATSVVYNALAQKSDMVAEYRYQLREGQKMLDNAAAELIKIKSDSTTIDSLKVEIVFLLAEAGCALCIEHLIDNYFEFFNYGEGISDGDQARQVACLHSISIMLDSDVDKWKLIVPFLNSLKTNRDNTWLEVVSRYLSFILTKPGFKILVEKEIEKNNWTDNVYKQNLQKIMAMLSK